MPYANINPTGCGIHKNRAKLCLDFFLNPDDPNYDKHHIYIVDETSKEFQQGHKGKVDDEGNPLDPEDYQKWLDGLPYIWRDNPFHSHFIYPDKDVSDAGIKAEIEKCLHYFYAFHQHCWDEGKGFIEEWKKVPSKAGDVRHPFMRGSSGDVLANEAKVQGILGRIEEFQVHVSEVPDVDLNIGEKGTIDVGSPAINRITYTALSWAPTGLATRIDYNNPANASGTLDTIEVYFNMANAGNCFRVGTFSKDGSVFTCHDGYEIGEVPSAGYKEYTGLSIDVSVGEYLGADGKQAGVNLFVDANTTGGGGLYSKAGAYCDPEDSATFSFLEGFITSLYGTGTEAADHRKSSFFKMF